MCPAGPRAAARPRPWAIAARQLSGGFITIDGQTMYDRKCAASRPSSAGVDGLQSYAVRPHMTVFDNVAYGLRACGAGGEPGQCRAALDLVQMRHSPTAAPPSCRAASRAGGMARAIAFAHRRVVDEPLSNLTPGRRWTTAAAAPARHTSVQVNMTRRRRRHLRPRDRMNVGVIEHRHAGGDLQRPRSRFVADFAGSANLSTAASSGHHVRGEGGTIRSWRPRRAGTTPGARTVTRSGSAPGDVPARARPPALFRMRRLQ
jgi:ABC-type Fe3+/spermidine/putrescine transport system ATPase subunit